MDDGKTILDFLNKDFDNTELKSALKILYEFKRSFSFAEDLYPPCLAWSKLEQLQEFLEYRVNKKPLGEDTMEYIEAKNFKLKRRI